MKNMNKKDIDHYLRLTIHVVLFMVLFFRFTFHDSRLLKGWTITQYGGTVVKY